VDAFFMEDFQNGWIVVCFDRKTHLPIRKSCPETPGIVVQSVAVQN